MKKALTLFIVSFLLILVFATSAYALRTTKLLDRTYIAQGCLAACANPELCNEVLCKDIDSVSYGFQKTFTQEVDVYPSGQIAVFVDREKGGDAPYGGIDPNKDVLFLPNDGGDPVPVGDGLQVFKPGKVVLHFSQPYDDLYRREMEFRVIIYFYPHNQYDLDRQRQQRISDAHEFEQYKTDHVRDISDLCSEFSSGSILAPNACVPEKTVITRQRTQQGSLYVNQSESNRHKPLATLDRDTIFAFLHQPLSVDVLSVEDPDGLCDEYVYLWDTVSGPDFSFAVDDLGNASFSSTEAGDFTVRFRLKESCVGHSLISDPLFVRVKISDRNTIFWDMPANHKYREYLYDLYALGVVQGYPDGSVKPDKLVSRAEFLKMLFGTARVAVPTTAFSYAFPDVIDGQWYASYVHYAKNLDIVQGYPDNYFRPTSSVNLAEALKMMLQITDIELKESLDVWFGDVDPDDWFSRYVQTAYREGILDEVQPQQNVFPERLLTRGEVAKLLVRTFLKPVNRINMVNVNKLP